MDKERLKILLANAIDLLKDVSFSNTDEVLLELDMSKTEYEEIENQ